MRANAWRVAGLALLVARGATGQSGFWEPVRDPSNRDREAAVGAVERMLWNAEQSYGVASMERDFTLAAVSMAELAGGGAPDDLRIALFRGRALASCWIRQSPVAQSLLTHVLDRKPAPALAGDAWFRLGVAAACSGDSEGAIRAYRAALHTVWEAGLRSEIELELGETLFAQGDVTAAAEAFDLAVRLALKRRVEVQAYFGLAAALERSGHPNGAIAAARTARSIVLPRPHYGSDDALTFPARGCVPLDAERHFRQALGHTAVALGIVDVDERAVELEAAIDAWNDYLALTSVDQLGRTRAELRRAQCRAELVVLREAAVERARGQIGTAESGSGAD